MSGVTRFDVIVIGGGHAGCEAAAASARLGAKTVLATQNLGKIGELSCNPAIGGLGKGHLVREIDALDGLMGRVADKSGIQFRVLNRSKGPAVRGPRAQMDRFLYRKHMQAELRAVAGLTLLEVEVDDLIVRSGCLVGVRLSDGSELACASVVVATGTFLNGKLFRGDFVTDGGRYGDRASIGLSRRFYHLGLEMGRLKTGTPPRLDGRTINFDMLERQKGDEEPEAFSCLSKALSIDQIDCFVTHTNLQTHDIIKQNIELSSMYSGLIEGEGPRYCPSIEQKIVRFADRSSHQVFLEPEGFHSNWYYPNGVSTSLPDDVQLSFIRSMRGLENAAILQSGYAVEYDYVNPRELDRSLQLRKLAGVYLAGQINGTTGYEEAGAQGLLAGANAALKALERDCFVLSRTNAYLGVLVDDLINHGVSEPYRMFTSRAEFRLFLRADNADQRLTEPGIAVGLIGDARISHFKERKQKLDHGRSLMGSCRCTPKEAQDVGIRMKSDGQYRSAFELLANHRIDRLDVCTIWPELLEIEDSIFDQLVIDARYAPYLARQRDDVSIVKRDERTLIPRDLDYSDLQGLSQELMEKLQLRRPLSIADAQKIEGITPAAILIVLSAIKRGIASVSNRKTGT